MKPILIKLVVKELRNTADKLEAGTSFLSEEECTDILETLTHTALSKDEACSYLRISRATFDNRVAAGEYPKGKKLRGRKELIWFKDELVMN